LELLDGLVETPGRIVIVTTNHPDELDQALIRPGRIDLNIHFTKASRHDIASMFQMWYGIEIIEEQLQQLKEYEHTHAELCQVFFNHIEEPLQALAMLQRKNVDIDKN
jgi:ATP-dependent 26S proteasome regulatory subunit